MQGSSKRSRRDRSTWSLKPSTSNSVVRYFAAVSAGFVLDYAIFAALVLLGASIYLANAAAFVAGSALNLLLIREHVFPENRFDWSTDFLLTLGANGCVLGLGMALLWILADLWAMEPLAAKLVANAVTFCVNYLTRRLYFSRPSG